MKIAGPRRDEREPDADHGVVREHVREQAHGERQDARQIEQDLEEQEHRRQQPEVDVAPEDLLLEEARPHELAPCTAEPCSMMPDAV